MKEVKDQIKWAFSTKADGPCNFVGHEVFDGERRANIASFLANRMRSKMERAVFPRTHHGAHVVSVANHNPIWGAVAGDAIVTDKKGLVLTMPFADCYPVILYDHLGDVLALAHCGWRGTASGIIENTINVMRRDFGSETKDIRVIVGPGICKEHFEVGEEVISTLMRKTTFPGMKTKCDLRAEIHKRIHESGVSGIDIVDIAECTYEGEYYSFRRDRISNPLPAGIAAVVMVE